MFHRAMCMLFKRRLNQKHRTASSDKTNLHRFLRHGVYKLWRLQPWASPWGLRGPATAVPPPEMNGAPGLALGQSM